MKLIKLSIKNFRGINGENNFIEFNNSNIIFLIGQNNVGKSSFLHAYEFFTNPSQKASKEDFFNYDSDNPIEIIGEFYKETEDDTNSDFSNEPEWINKWVDGEGKIFIKKVWNEIGQTFKKFTFNPNSEVNEYVANGFGGFDSLFKKYSPTPIFINAIETVESFEKKINEVIEKEYLKTIQTKFGDEYAAAKSAIDSLQSKIVTDENTLSYNDSLNANFKKIFPELSLKISQKDIDSIDIIKAFKSNHSISIEKNGIERKENFEQHGHGVIRQVLFNFIAFLKNQTGSSRKEFLILFEEPELFLHPKSISLLREELYRLAENSPFQILCATHSAGMIDVSKPHSSLVRVTKLASEETKTFQVGHSIFQSEENKDFVQMINRFNPNVCETFYSDNVILVEGDTEAIVFRELIKRINPNLDLFVLNTGSKNNIPFFQKILTHFSINHIVIHDSDTRYVYNKDYTEVSKNRDDSFRSNSAWTLNTNIWTQIEQSNGLAKRYVFIYNFEYANNYVYNEDKGKPLSAYEYAKEIDLDGNSQLVKFAKFVTGEIISDTDFTNDYLEQTVQEPNIE